MWDSKSELSASAAFKNKRETFEYHLKQEGLMLSRDEHEETGLNFVKIYAPSEVLKRYAEILKLRLPMRKFDHIQEVQVQISSIPFIGEVVNQVKVGINRFVEPLMYNRDKIPPKNQDLTAVFSRDKEYLFDLDRPNFFTQSTRARVIEFILKRKRLTTDEFDDFAFGIERALTDGVYTAAYPLHDVSDL